MKEINFKQWLEMGMPTDDEKQSNELVAKTVADMASSMAGADPSTILKDPRLKAQVVANATKAASKNNATVNVSDIVSAMDKNDPKMMKKK